MGQRIKQSDELKINFSSLIIQNDYHFQLATAYVIQSLVKHALHTARTLYCDEIRVNELIHEQ